MGLFSRKTKADAGQFSRDFYDRSVFGPDPTGGDFAERFAESTRRLVSEADPAFAALSLPKLKEELRALRLEMIGTAWTHESKPEAALAVSEFTKGYLAGIGRSDLWEAMTDYNKAVADSTTYGADPKTGSERARIVFVNTTRANLFEGWVTQGRDPEAAARVANRAGSETNWKSGITQFLVAVQMTRRLGIEDSDPIWERLAAVAYGFYQGAKEALEGVQLNEWIDAGRCSFEHHRSCAQRPAVRAAFSAKRSGVVDPCGPFCGPACAKRAQTTRNNTRGACQKLNKTNSFQHAPIEAMRV